MKKQQHHINGIWLRFLAGSLPILLIPIIIMFFIYGKSISVINEQTFEKHLAALENSTATIESTIENIESIASYMDSDSKIDQFLQSKNPFADGATTIDFINAQKDIRALTISNQLFDNLQIYSTKNEVLLDASTISIVTDSYYNGSFEIDGYSAEKWEKEFLTPIHNFDIFPNLDITFLSATEKQIIFAQSLPINNKRQHFGNLFVCVSEDKLLKPFQAISYTDGGFLCILDNQSLPIIQKNCTKETLEDLKKLSFSDGNGYVVSEINGEDMFLTFSRGNINDWVYVAATPKSLVLKPTNSIRLSIILLIVFALIAGGVLLVICSSQLSKPLVKIYRVLFPIKRNLSYVDFADEVSKLVQTNDDMKNALREQIPALKASVFYNLLLGEFNDKESITESLTKIGVDLDGKFFIVLIAALNELSPQDSISEVAGQKIYLGEKLSSGFTGIRGMYNLDFERIVLLIASNADSYIDAVEVAEKEADKIAKQLLKEQSVSISFSGALCDDISKIPEAFYHAQSAMNYASKNAVFTVLWYSAYEETESHNFYFPITIESEILTAVKHGGTAQLASLFDKVEHRNKKLLKSDNEDASKNLMIALKSTLMRVLNEIVEGEDSFDSVYGKLCSGKSDFPPFETFYLLKEAFCEIASANGYKFKQKESNIKERLKAYVNLHFSDPQISLTAVADEFGITEVYLSRLFKQITGENFSKYIEKMRMKEANRLIELGGLTRNEIARMVGYNSPQVFRRAFKRHFDVSDSDM